MLAGSTFFLVTRNTASYRLLDTPWAEPRPTDEEFAAFVAEYPVLDYRPWNYIDPQIKSLLVRILNVDGDQRYSLAEISSSDWFLA